MPQMAPIWWTFLFIMFVLSIMMIYTMMYYTFNKLPHTKTKMSKTINNTNWKW